MGFKGFWSFEKIGIIDFTKMSIWSIQVIELLLGYLREKFEQRELIEKRHLYACFVLSLPFYTIHNSKYLNNCFTLAVLILFHNKLQSRHFHFQESYDHQIWITSSLCTNSLENNFIGTDNSIKPLSY